MKVRAIEAAKRRVQRRAIVALAHRLAVIMPRMWTDGTDFRWARQASRTARAPTEKKKG